MSYKPEAPNIYQGKQIIIDSDRLIFNAKDDSILLFSDKAIGFSTNGNFHFDTSNDINNKFIINAPNIYLGLKTSIPLSNPSELPTEPVVLGNKLKDWMTGDEDELTEGLLDVLDSILDMIESDISYIAPLFGATSPNYDNLVYINRR